jgi:hypothetical protein
MIMDMHSHYRVKKIFDEGIAAVVKIIPIKIY